MKLSRQPIRFFCVLVAAATISLFLSICLLPFSDIALLDENFVPTNTGITTKRKKDPLLASSPIKQWYLDRGTNLLRSHSGCFIARWSYIGFMNGKGSFLRHLRDDCEFANPKQIMNSSNIGEVRDWDTVYVPFSRLKHWVKNCASKLLVRGTKIVLILGEGAASDADVSRQLDMLLSFGNIRYIFCMDIKLRGGDPKHPKLKPWPLGLSYQKRPHKAYDPIGDYRKIFLENVPSIKQKNKDILISYLSHTHASRDHVPHTENKTTPGGFYKLVVPSRFVLSPDGARPECHRHYEALGLGAIPITSLDPQVYWHLRDGPVIFNNSNWNVSSLTAELGAINLPSQANRNMIFEEYWMEYVEHHVGRELVWWDRLSEEPRRMQDFDLVTTN